MGSKLVTICSKLVTLCYWLKNEVQNYCSRIHTASGFYVFQKLVYFYLCVCHMCTGVLGGQDKASDPLELEL